MAPLSLSDDQAEQLLTADAIVDSELQRVAEVLRALRDAAVPDPHADFSHLFVAAARESRMTPIEQFANEQIVITDDWSPRVVQRAVIAGTALFAIVAMSSGLAYAANGAKPGDLLYGLDRAIEAIGIANGGAEERLAEAQALVALGEVPRGLTHAVEVIAGTAAGQAGGVAMEAAATRLENGPVGPESRDAVQALLDYIHGAGDQVEGQIVALYAHDIGGRPDDPGNSENAAGQQDDGAPGKSENAPGQQDDEAPGKSESAPGQQEDEQPGSSEKAPGDEDDDEPGNSEKAPGDDDDEDDKDDEDDESPGNSDQAPGDDDDNPGKGPPGGGPPGQGGG